MSFEHEGFFADVHVPGRGDSLDTCAWRTFRMLGLLKDVDQSFSQWFAQGWTHEEALTRRLDMERDILTAAFETNRIAGRTWHSLGAWNGLDDSASTFHVFCGNAPPGIDTITFDPHEAGPTGERLLQAPVMTALLRALAIAWEPQAGIVMSHRHREVAFKDAEFEHRIGWVNYFSRSLGSLPALPDPVQVEPVDDIGSLVILTAERFVTSNPAHVALSLQVSATLREAGVLKPLLAPSPPPGATS